ncbi:sulfite exporter TauE/SafE family protein [Clostridium aestuarii]|uniref:Sulfite exporter TauE/SafE family protein n=1 Tax=Clostridium aestuarii TaxID=338193 RepID=A0ABT4D2U4_9CLOT|nr:sulfite exporter TauE/SafE family protein [Clostridium aestuarii]MCY6485565.1 sulfite exporter TauE/SafE family protein [Clostridium aestuarii]
MRIKKETFKVKDMHCKSCEQKLEKELKKLTGVINIIASYEESSVFIAYDSSLCSTNNIKKSITKSGYSIGSSNKTFSEIIKILGILLIAGTIIILGNYSGGFDMSSILQQEVTYFVLFIIGLFTSVHCIGMCGGIMISQNISTVQKNKWQSIKPSILYNTGRIISYTILGGIVGAIGSIFSISLEIKSSITIFAGIFMIIMGFNMSGFNLFRKFHITLPWSTCSIKNKSKAPFIVGILNGLMPCGPLQTMQLYALGTGSAVQGALSMFIFSLGTVPLMLSFGLATSFLSKNFSKKILKFSGILVFILGFIMINRGLALSGINLSPKQSLLKSNSTVSFAKAEIQDNIQIVKINADYSGYNPNIIYVQKGIPVKWIIDGKQISSCNNEIIIPSLNIQKKLISGENIIEFTPGNEDINFSCWMGMLRGIIKVTNDLETVDTSNTSEIVPSSSGSNCCSVPIN